MKRFVALCLSLALLAGCGWPEVNEQTALPEPEVTVEAETAEKAPDVPPYFKVEFLAEENFLQEGSIFIGGEDKILCGGSSDRSQDTPKELFWTDYRGETKTEIPITLEDGEGIRGMTVGEDGNIYLILSRRVEVERNSDGIPWNFQGNRLLVIDETGVEIGSYPIQCEDGSVSDLTVSEEGDVYLVRCEYNEETGFFSSHYIDQYNRNGEVISSLPVADIFPAEKRVTCSGFLTTPAGEILVKLQINEYDRLYPLSMESLEYTSPVFEFEEGMDWPSFCTGPGADYYVQDDNLGFLAYSLTEKPKTLFHLGELDSTVPESSRFVAEIGEYTYLFATWVEGCSYFFTVTGQWEPLPETEKTVLTVGSFLKYAGGSILQKVTLFNILHPEVELKIKMYSVDENTPEGYVEPEAANEALQMDILNGEGPDILILDSYSFQPGVYAGNGYLTDLAPLIEADDTFIKEDYFSNLWKTESGVVRYMPVWLNMMTMVAAGDLAGEGGWTPTEAKRLMDDTGIPFVCGSEFLKEYVLGDGLMDYIEGDTCNFTDGEFAAMLELLTLEDLEVQMEEFRLRNRSVLAEFTYLYSFSELLYAEDHYGEYALKGIPSPQEEVLSIAVFGGVGIAENCDHKELAWEFIKTMMDSTGGISNGFSVKREDVIAQLEAAMLPEDDPDSELAHSGYQVGDLVLTGKPISQEQADLIIKSIETAKPQMVDADLKAIVQEECEAFFAGDKTAEEVAELVQNRVMIYLSERS